MVNIIRKRDPHRSLKMGPVSDEQDSTDIEMARLKRRQSRPMSVMSGVSSVSRVSRPATAMASRTDMSTGIVSVDRGFDFATEENGVALQRMQSNLSERQQRMSSTGKQKRRRRTLTVIPSFTLPRSLRRKRPPTTDEEHFDSPPRPERGPSSSPRS